MNTGCLDENIPTGVAKYLMRDLTERAIRQLRWSAMNGWRAWSYGAVWPHENRKSADGHFLGYPSFCSARTWTRAAQAAGKSEGEISSRITKLPGSGDFQRPASPKSAGEYSTIITVISIGLLRQDGTVPKRRFSPAVCNPIFHDSGSARPFLSR